MSSIAPALQDILEKSVRELGATLAVPKAAFPTSRVVYWPVEKETRSENPHAG